MKEFGGRMLVDFRKFSSHLIECGGIELEDMTLCQVLKHFSG